MATRNKYIVQITYYDSKEIETKTISTESIEWSMSQYQRNRKPFDWEVIHEESH